MQHAARSASPAPFASFAHEPARKTEVLPRLRLVVRVAQQIGRVIGDDHRGAAALEALSARGANRDLALQQGLRSRPPERDQDVRLDERDLALQIGQTAAISARSGVRLCGGRHLIALPM